MIHLGTPRPSVQPTPTPPPPPNSAGEGSQDGATDDDDATDHVVHFHVNPGVTVSLQVGDCIRVVKGPMTVPMVPTVRPSPPPMPMPVQVPVGHMVQQIVDETGQLRHVILSPHNVAGSPGPPPRVDPNQPPQGMQPPADFFPGFYAPTLMPPPPHGPAPPLHHPNPVPGMVRDERSNRQYHKLKRRLEHKQQQQHQQPSPQQVPSNIQQASSSLVSSSPPASPNRKPPSGVTRRTKERSMVNRTVRESSSSPLSPSDQSAPLSPSPSMVLTVSDIQQCGALLTWAPADASTASMSGSEDSGVAGSEVSGGATPLPCDPPPTMYQVMVGKRGPDGAHKIVYFGPEFSHQLDDLTPGTEYSVKLAVLPVGESSPNPVTALASFVSLPAPPVPPPMPKLGNRTKTTLTVKWNSSPNCGMPITQYTVELCENITEGGEKVWKQVYTGKERQCLISRLSPGNQYFVRVAATNELGTSEFSPEASFSTISPPPAAPSPPFGAPQAVATSTSLSVCWKPAPTSPSGPVTYTLEMASVRIDDPSLTPEELTKRVIGGFMPVYHGPECQHVCTNLMPATAYLFRLRVNAMEGPCSAWSPPARLVTSPIPPHAPPKPQARGRLQPQAIRVKWEPPVSSGGVPLQGYLLQVNDGTGYQDVWTGTGLEALVSGLMPGRTYSIRVAASNSAGQGAFSEPLRASTSPVPPGAPTWARKQPPPLSHCISLHWDPPSNNGGATISQYEVELCSGDVEDSTRTSVYRGVEPRCEIISGLAPATKYALWVRAVNAAGSGPWSSILRVETAVAPPSMPAPPQVVVCKGGTASFTWEPLAMAVTYCLKLAPFDPESSPSPCEQPAAVDESSLDFDTVYSGADTKCEVKRLLPGVTYLAKLQGSNSSGSGSFCEPVKFTTPLSPPGALPHAPRLTSLESDGENVILSLTFEPPNHFGGDKEECVSYQLEISVAGEHAGSPQLVVCQASPVEDLILALDTAYRVRVRAVNSVGPGPLSSALRLTTPPPPPPAPRLNLAAAMPRALRLSWEPAEDQLSVCVEARRGETQEFQVVYEGSELGCKVSRLREDCEYQFRARASGKGGEGFPGPIHAFRTLPAPKPVPRGVKVSDVTSVGCVLAWQASKPQHQHSSTSSDCELHSYVQVSNQRIQGYSKVYRGPDLKYTLADLLPRTEYWFRVAFVSADGSDPEEGPFSTPISVTTLAPEPVTTIPAPSDSTDSSKEVAAAPALQLSLSLPKLSLWPALKKWRRTSVKDLSDHQKVFLFVMGFVVSSVVLAMLISRFM